MKFIGVVTLTYLPLSLVNMGLVLLMFSPAQQGSARASVWLLVPAQIAVVAAAAYSVPVAVKRLLAPADNSAFWIALALIVTVSGFNIYLDVALEPLWYKLLYLAVLIPVFTVSLTRKRHAAPDVRQNTNG